MLTVINLAALIALVLHIHTVVNLAMRLHPRCPSQGYRWSVRLWVFELGVLIGILLYLVYLMLNPGE